MSTVHASLNEPTNFSLVQGGPLFQLLFRAGLAGPSMGLATRRIAVLTLMAWLPLAGLTLWAGQALGGVDVPFLEDVAVHVRLLVGIPLLVGAEVVVHQRLRGTLRQFLERDLVAPADLPRFQALIASAMRWRNSVVAEVLILLFTVFAASSLMQRYIGLEAASWQAVPRDGQPHFTAAGTWYLYVSLTIVRFLLFRWYYRLLIWYRFLWQVSRRIPLQLNALHPDRCAGLGFLSGSLYALTPILLAHTVALAGVIGGRIWHDHATLPQFKLDIALWMIVLLAMAVGPLFCFMGQLAHAKRVALREYGLLASRYVADFHRKWVTARATTPEGLLGTGDIQSLADLGNSFDVVRETGLVPVSRSAVLRLAVVLLVPFAPLLLTLMPLEALIDRALGALL